MDTFIFLDIEATLINGKQHIIEIGAIKWMPNNTFETFEQLIKPIKFKRLNRHIQDLTGITTEELQNAKPFKVVIQDFIEWCGGYEKEKIFVTFGEFDRKVLEEEFSRHQLRKEFLYPIVDYQQKYMIAHQEKNQPSLNRLMETFNLENEQQHRALADANSLLKIFLATDGLQLVENQKTNDFSCILCDMVQKENFYEVYLTYITGTIENEYITINEIKTLKRHLVYQIQEVEKVSADGELSIAQVYNFQSNQEIQSFLHQFTEHLENHVLITLGGLKHLSKIVRIHGISIPKTETMTLKQLINDENELSQFKLSNGLENDELKYLRLFEKFQNEIIDEFKRRNLFKDEVKI
ncbi:exonuclease domain-containing protein [Ureibacillus acetophenoni]